MRRQLGTISTTGVLLALTLVLALALTSTTLAQTKVSAESGGGAKVTASASASVAIRKDTDPDPVPYNILDEVDADTYSALLGWSSKYRIGLGVQDGDWVKYETVGDGPKETLEIRASKTDAGETWIVETTKKAGSTRGTELHALFSPGKPKLLQAFRIDESGVREDITPLADLRAGELFLEAKRNAEDAMGVNKYEYRVVGVGGIQELTGPFGTLTCRGVEVQIAEELDPVSFEPRRRWLTEGSLVWLNEDVPRLIPMSAVLLPSLLSPDDMMSVPGGMVRSAYHVLVDYKGRS